MKPLSWTEITMFALGTKRVSEAFEIELLRDMSLAYVAGMKLGEDPLSISPWGGL